ncbi:MAG TPA: hypothetical protein VII59_15850 [Streptosporangiaceae bacterium]
MRPGCCRSASPPGTEDVVEAGGAVAAVAVGLVVASMCPPLSALGQPASPRRQN